MLRCFLRAGAASTCLVVLLPVSASAQLFPDYQVGGGAEETLTGRRDANRAEIGAEAPGSSPSTGTLILSDGGQLNVTDEVIVAPSAGSVGHLAFGGLKQDLATDQQFLPGLVTGGPIRFGSGDGLVSFYHASPDFELDTQIIGGPTARMEFLAGRTIINGDQSAFQGTTQVVGSFGSASGVGTMLQVNGQLGGTIDLRDASWLEGTGTVGTVIHRGDISPGTPLDPFGTLTIAGDHEGHGGWLTMDVVLGGDDSRADRLIVNGDTRGVTGVNLQNRGGIGAPTTQGILLIQVDGASNGVFDLTNDERTPDGRRTIYAGAYAYSLYKGSVGNPADGNWYLRSTAKVDLLPAPTDPDGSDDPTDGTDPDLPTLPISPVVPGAPSVPSDPSAPVELEPDPLFQPGVPLYEAYPSLLLDMNRLPTLRQRVGNRVWSGTADPQPFRKGAVFSEAPLDLFDGRAAWGRIEGRGFKTTPDASGSGWQADGASWRLQAGIDAPVHTFDTGSVLVGGVWLSHGRGTADVSSASGGGTIDTVGTGVGASLTMYTQSGFYTDVQLQGTWYSSDLYSDVLDQTILADHDGFGWGASVEIGRSFDIAYAWSVTPQAQLMWNSVDIDGFTDFSGADVRLLRGDSLAGRIGVSLDREMAWETASGETRRLQLYGIVDLTQEFLDGTRIDVAGTVLTSEPRDTTLGIGIGGTYNWKDDAYSLFGQVGVNAPLDRIGDDYEVSATAGLRLAF